jgi:hypothetical protein
MIDWYMTQFLYPVAFKRFIDVMFPNIGIISISILEFYDMKKLYQFFDKEGIYLTTEMYKPNVWTFTVSLHNGIVFGPGNGSKTNREEIEYEGFLECFKILEKLLRS